MLVVITSTGGVSKRLFTFESPVDPGLATWAGAYLNEQLVGLGLGARMLWGRLQDPSLPATERAFLGELRPRSPSWPTPPRTPCTSTARRGC
jgi:heat-inducible transcriptional repressor